MEPLAEGASANLNVTLDRFSALPREVAHHVLSFLPISDITRVGMLSQECRAFYLSTPTLNFTEFPSESTRAFNSRLELMASLDKFFIHRHHNKVQSFSLDWVSKYELGETDIEKCCSVEKSRVLGWIENALTCNVEKLDFFFLTVMPTVKDIISETQIDFPSSVFVSGSLRSLSLLMKRATLKASTFSASSICNLVFLTLRSVTMEDDEGFCKWICFCCRNIKELTLEFVIGLRKIDIESSSLESFGVEFPSCCDLCHVKISGEKVEDLRINWKFNAPLPRTNSLEIFAPNLKRLNWVGYMMNHQNLGELNCLEEVQISLMADGVDDPESKTHEFLSSIRSAKTLRIDQGTAKNLFKDGNTPPILHELCCLHVTIWSGIDDKVVPALASLFKGLSNLTTLELTVSSDQLPFFFCSANAATSSGFDRRYWERQHLEFVSQLKYVTIELTNGSNGFVLAKYLLERAQNLEEMLVICLPNQWNFARKLRSSRIISSNAAVGYLEKSRGRTGF
ncbi:putative F-box/LRR-repeat protein At3g28410 [Pyrus x bretschneideri]|uniref:putative F-box/LRR-repeat protein At3g28410 n=1 Tax=Pyrus x bretschneideri TaxID=225117 RepID=UPI0005109DB2|nr:putative F-box/LRR-repeat protein At3g28410 [Pyrus x bretschneideri]